MDQSLQATLAELLGRTAKHWGLWVSGAVASAASFLLPAMGVTKVPPSVLGWIGLGLLVMAFIRTFHDVRVERNVALVKLQPVLELGNNDAACIHNERWDDNRFQLRRLVVTNVCGTSVAGIKVSVIACRYRGPDDDIGHHHQFLPALPWPLKPQHARDVTAEFTFVLAPGDKRLIDVVSLGRGRRTGNYEIWQSIPGITVLIPSFSGDSYLLDVQVVGENVPAVTKTVRFSTDDNGNLALVLVS
jgi:hypothetical protein